MILNLNALRALAAWMVVAHHLRDHLGRIWAPLGETLVFAAGVDVFFVLSGVVMVVSTHGRGMRPAAFWARRLARVAPLYWLATLTLAAALAAGASPVGVTDWDAGDLAAALAFWPDIRADGFPGPLLAVGWTLTCEAAFYALFGFALLFGRSAPVVALGALAALVAAGAAAPEGAPYPLLAWTAPLMLEFAAGVLIGIWWTATPRRAPMPGLWRLPVSLAAAALAIGASRLPEIAGDAGLIAPWAPGAGWRVFCFGLPAALLVLGALLAERSGAVMRQRWAHRQGDASYAVYLLHLPLIQIAETLAGPAALLVAPPLVAVAALAVHRAVERPLTAALASSLGAGAGQQRPKSSSRRMMSSSSR